MKDNSQNNFNAFAAPDECSNEQALEKLKSMNSNRKGIGSDDLFVDNTKTAEISGRLNSLSGAT